MSNEFKGADLRNAVRQATAAYGGQPPIEAKSFCEDLQIRFRFNKQEADRIFDRIVDLQREVDRLKQQARDAEIAAAIAALSGLAGSLGSVLRGLGKLRALRLDRFTRQDLLGLIPFIGGALSAAAAAASAASALEEAKTLQGEIERLETRFNNLGDDMLDITESFERANCYLGSAGS